MIAAYKALLHANIAVGLTYRTRLSLWVLTSLFPLLFMAVWLAIVDEVGPANGWDRVDFISYYAAAALLWQTTTSFVIWSWDRDIRSGDFSIKLLKPIDPFHQYLTHEFGLRLVLMVILVPILVVVTLLVPGLTYELDTWGWVFTVLAALAGFFLNVIMALAFATIAFWTTQAANIYSLWWGIGSFLSGWIAPLPLMPPIVEATGRWMPFRSSMGFPLELLLGRLSGPEIARSFAVTAGWIVVFGLLYRLGWRSGIRRYQAVGG
jgi:ABC-2 type transport system permease protein